MERDLKIPAVVIGHSSFGEMHRSVKLLSPQQGIIDTVIYGGRKGKKSALAPLFSYGTFSLYYNPVNNEYSLTDEDISFYPQEINLDIHTNCTASFFCEIVTKLDSQDYSEIYTLLCSCLTILEKRTDLCDKLIIGFIWRLLILSGIEPDLSRCPICDRLYSDDEILGYSSSLNTPACKSCADLEFPALLPGCRRFLKYTENMDIVDLVKVELFDESVQRIKNYLISYIKLFCSRPLKTLESGLL